MRLRIVDEGVHEVFLCYCLNVHPGETRQDVEQALFQSVPAVYQQLQKKKGYSGPYGAGLWLNESVARGLDDKQLLNSLGSRLASANLEVLTLNGFPMGDFSGCAGSRAIKQRVYSPDWSDSRRLEYTLRLARILTALPPKTIRGSISTLPVSYRAWTNEQRLFTATHHLAEATLNLARLRDEKGVAIRLALEPEPDCWLERASDVVSFFENQLLTIGRDHLVHRYGYGVAHAEEVIREHLGICLDTVHEAVVGENPQSSLKHYSSAGIGVFKIQLGAALICPVGERSRLTAFAEPIFLHQTRVHCPDGSTAAFPDLSPALRADLPPEAELRVHFHLPLCWPGEGALTSSRSEIDHEFLQAAVAVGVQHFEVEVYTLEVMPQRSTTVRDLLAQELSWVMKLFNPSIS